MTSAVAPDYFAAEAFEENPAIVRDQLHRGQVRIAYRLEGLYAGRLMYVNGLGWHHWDGQRWAVDDIGAATRAVLEVLQDCLTESLHDPQLRSDVAKCESANGIKGVLEIASALPALRVHVDDLDADPYLLNCANGTLDLRPRTLRGHDPADRITKVTLGAYVPERPGGAWEKFLATVLGPEELAYLRTVFGQAVYGAVREHLFPVLTGTGGNGKGVTYGAVVHALGDYAIIIDPELLMTSTRGAGGPEMMQLLGARLVIGSETEEGRQLDAALMKRLTGGDILTARHLYQEPVQWHPSHQIVYVTNHLPKVKGNDPAVWRRIRVIPFDVVIPPEDRDPALPEKLEQCADEILTWAVQGWFDYIDHGGMNEPDRVKSATEQYQTESDAVKRFTLDPEACLISPHASAGTRQLHQAFTQWAAADGADPISEKVFSQELDRLGYPARRTKTGMSRQGIGIAATDRGF